MTMESLNKLYWIKKEIKKIENQIKELTFLSSVSLDGMPKGSGTSSPVERLYERLEKLKYKLATKREKYIAEQERLEDFLETIDDAEVRVYARGRFIEHKSFEQIGNENYVDRTTVSKKLKDYIEGRMTDD